MVTYCGSPTCVFLDPLREQSGGEADVTRVRISRTCEFVDYSGEDLTWGNIFDGKVVTNSSCAVDNSQILCRLALDQFFSAA